MSKESEGNKGYNAYVEKLALQGDEFCRFRRERQMDFLFKKLDEEFKGQALSTLDMCGGYGRLLWHLVERYPSQSFTCLDISEELIRRAKRNFNSFSQVKCDVGDLYRLSKTHEKKFDITILYKTLGYLPYYEEAIRELVAVTKGKIYMTCSFSEGDLDFITKIYENDSYGTETFLHTNSYGAPRFVRFCDKLGVKKVEFEDMKLDFDVAKPTDGKLQTYTERLANGQNLEINGMLVLNWKLVTLTL